MKRIIYILLIMSSITLSAQNELFIKSLTLDEVLQLAQDQSLQALQALHTFRSSYWEYRTYQAKLLPSLTLNSTLPSFKKTIVSNNNDDGTVDYVKQYNMTTSVDVELNQNVALTGGRIFVNSSLSRLDNFGNDPYTNYKADPVSIGFSQPINGYNSLKWDKKIEPLKYEEAKKTYLNSMELVNQRAVGYFFDLVLAQINLEIAKKNYANTDTLYRIAEGRYQLGTIAENELLQMELSFLNSGTALNEATIDLELGKSRLRSYLGFNEKVSIELLLPHDIPDLNLEFSETLQAAKENNPEILQMQRQLLTAERNVAQARSEKGLQANLYASYGLSQNANQLSTAYTNPEDGELVEIGLQVPILDWGQGRGQLRMAQSAQELARTDVQQAQIDFDENVFLQVMRFNLQDDQVHIAAKADTIADFRYEVSKQRFLIGKIDVLDLNVALEEKDVARRGYVQALRNYWSYYYNIRGLTLYDWVKKTSLSEDFDELMKD